MATIFISYSHPPRRRVLRSVSVLVSVDNKGEFNY